MINFSINISDDQKDQIVVETLLNDYFNLTCTPIKPKPSDYAEDLKIKDAIETILSSWYMPKGEFDKVVSERREESAEKKVNKEKDKQSPYFIDPLQGYKWGFPKNISQENVLGDTMKWLVDNGYPKEVMEEFGKHFKFTIWKEPKKDQ